MMLASNKWIALFALVALGALPTAAQADNHGPRPADFTMGIGAGWDLPSDIDIINTASVRFRLASGLTFEPRIELSGSSSTTEAGDAEATDSTSAIVIATTARMPIMSRGPMDFIVLGGANLTRLGSDPEGADNNTTTTIMALVWGVSVEWWISQRWVFSFSAINPLVSRVSTTTDSPVGDTVDRTTAFGLVFDPNIIAMFHLFY